MPAIAAPGLPGPSQGFSENEKTPIEPRTETNQPGDTYTCHLRPASSAEEKNSLSTDVISSKERNTSSFILAVVETPPDPIHYTAEVSSIVKPVETVISQPGHVKGLAKSAKFVHRRGILPNPDVILLPPRKHRSSHPFLSNVTIPPDEHKKFVERRNYTRRRRSTPLTSYKLPMEKRE
jgi:hypothetical protein